MGSGREDTKGGRQMQANSIAKAHKRLYKKIPGFKCKEGCTDCCGPIPFSRWEWGRIKDKRKAMSVSCPYSLNGKCDIYEKRPLICRLYGTVEGELECPHGRKPAKMLTQDEAQRIMKEYFLLLD